MTSRGEAIAGLAEDVGRALVLFAERLRDAEAVGAGPPEPAPLRAGSARVGGTQLALLEALRSAGAAGMTTKEVADEVGMQRTNAPRALKALEDRGLVSKSDGPPALWVAVPGD